VPASEASRKIVSNQIPMDIVEIITDTKSYVCMHRGQKLTEI
jgi:hypothetical protein